MNIDKLLVIIKREYVTRVESKGFILGTILTPLMMALLLVLPIFLMAGGSRKDYRIVVLDQTGDLALYQRAAELLTADDARHDRFQVRREAVTENQSDRRRQELNVEIVAGNLDLYVVIPAGALTDGKIAYHTRIHVRAGIFQKRSINHAQ